MPSSPIYKSHEILYIYVYIINPLKKQWVMWDPMSSASSPSHHHFYGWYAYHPGLSSGSCILAGPANPVRIAVPDDLPTFAWRCWVPNEILSSWMLRIIYCVYIHILNQGLVLAKYTDSQLIEFSQLVVGLAATAHLALVSWLTMIAPSSITMDSTTRHKNISQ